MNRDCSQYRVRFKYAQPVFFGLQRSFWKCFTNLNNAGCKRINNLSFQFPIPGAIKFFQFSRRRLEISHIESPLTLELIIDIFKRDFK